jgi:hypothetical protein
MTSPFSDLLARINDATDNLRRANRADLQSPLLHAARAMARSKEMPEPPEVERIEKLLAEAAHAIASQGIAVTGAAPAPAPAPGGTKKSDEGKATSEK